MARGKGLKQKGRKYFNVSASISNGQHGFTASCLGSDGTTFVLGFFSTDNEAARAADLACLACGRKGPLNFSKQIYLRKQVSREKQRLRKLGVLSGQDPTPQHKAAPAHAQQQAVQQQQQQQPAAVKDDQPEEEDLVLPGHAAQEHHRHKHRRQVVACQDGDQPDAAAKQPAPGPVHQHSSRKRKAASAAVLLSGAPSHQQQGGAAAVEEARHKRRKQTAQPASTAPSPPPAAAEPAAAAAASKSRRSTHHCAAAAAAAAPMDAPTAPELVRRAHDAAPAAGVAAQGSTALALPTGVLLPTCSAVQVGTEGSNQAVLMQQLRSALAAHEASKRQLHAALVALEASEGQLAAVARAAGLL